MRYIFQSICAMNESECDFEFTYEFIPTVNDPAYVRHFVAAAEKVVGPENVDANTPAPLTSEDFGRFLKEIPGCFFFIGTGKSPDEPSLHNPKYKFNDNILETAADIFVQLVRDRLK